MKRILAAAAVLAAAAACADNTESAAPAEGAAVEAPASEPAAAAAGGSELAAAEMEGPTPGLWRISMTMAGQAMPAQETCIQQTTFAEMQEMQQPDGVDCSQNSLRRDGTDLVGHSVCKIEDMTVTSDTRISGDFRSAYTMEVSSKMDPAPTPEMAQTNMTISAERIGDC